MLTARDKHRSSSPISLRFCILLAVLGFFALFVFGVDLFEFVSGNLSSECSENNSASSNSNAASNSCQFDLPCGSTIEGGFYRLFDEKTDTDPHANTTTFSLPNNSSALHCAYLCCESNWCNAWNFYVNLKQEAFCVLLKEEENRRATIVNAKQANVGLLFATGHLSGSKNPIFNQSNQETTIPIELLESLRHTIKNPNTEKKMFAKLSQISDELDQLDLALKVCQQNQGNDDAHQTAHDLHSKAEETFNTTLLLDAKHTELVGGRIHQRGDEGLVVGELATFQLDARDINNQPLSVGGATFLWGRVFSKIPNTFDKVAGIITPRMAFKGIITPIYFRDLKNGSYIGEYIVHEPGEYLVQIGFDGKAVAESPYDLTVSYLETDNLTEKPEKPQCTGSLSQRIKGGYWKNDKFELPFCKPRRYSKEEARQCLAKRNILLLGDSLTRVLFWTMTAFIEGKLLKSHFNGYNCAYNSTRDDYRINFRCGWNSLFTEGFPDPGTVRSGPGYHNGTQARWGIRESIWLGEEARNHAEWWINTKTGEYPDTWIINCGAHDMLLEDRKAFKYNLNELFRALKIGWGKDVIKHIIWMGNSAPVPWKQGKVFEHYKWKQTYAKSLTYDYDARNVASNYDVKFLHSFPLTYPRPELSYDGQHYVLSEDTQQDWVYMEQTQHLINELCQGVLW